MSVVQSRLPINGGEVAIMFSDGLGEKYSALYNIYEQVIMTIADYEEYQGYTLVDDMKESLESMKKLIEEELQQIYAINNSLLS